MYVYMYVCMCVRERERERERCLYFAPWPCGPVPLPPDQSFSPSTTCSAPLIYTYIILQY